MKSDLINYRKKIECKIKRNLLPSEIVHHKDGDNYNNKNSNFKILPSQKEHAKIPKIKKKINPKMYSKMIQLLHNTEESDFKKSLHTIFTKYQIIIIYRKLQKKHLSKTDREVFSRVIKKKLIALANNQLFKTAEFLLY